jgi:hypothetical protein
MRIYFVMSCGPPGSLAVTSDNAVCACCSALMAAATLLFAALMAAFFFAQVGPFLVLFGFRVAIFRLPDVTGGWMGATAARDPTRRPPARRI